MAYKITLSVDGYDDDVIQSDGDWVFILAPDHTGKFAQMRCTGLHGDSGSDEYKHRSAAEKDAVLNDRLDKIQNLVNKLRTLIQERAEQREE